METKKDCFGYISEDKYKGCFALKELYCKKENCRFYQERQQAKKKYLDNYSLFTAMNIKKNIDDYFRKEL